MNFSILTSFYRHFNEKKTKLETEWQNINRQMNMMKNQFIELKNRVDVLAVCLFMYAKRTFADYWIANSKILRKLLM